MVENGYLSFVNFAVGPQIDKAFFQDQQVEAGVNVGITCMLAKGDPPVSFRWTKDNEPLPMWIGAKVVNQEFSSLLSIYGTQQSHSGMYSCIASNDVASSVHSTRLDVNGISDH